MRRIAVLATGLVMVIGSTGCFCRHVTESYCDLIDQISDHEIEWDGLYHPELDLSRIGKPDWCRCHLNATLDGKQCAANQPCCRPRNRSQGGCDCPNCSCSEYDYHSEYYTDELLDE